MPLEIFNSEDFDEKAQKKFKTNFKSDQKKPEIPAGIFRITDIKQAVKNPNRANIFVNNKYRFSLDIFQLTQLGIKIGAEFSEGDLDHLEQQSEFGKLYARALDYCLMRPHSKKEVKDYLWKKTLTRKMKNRKTGEFYEKKGVSEASVSQVLERLEEKGYIDDEKFARFWVENRNQRKGSSMRKLQAELMQKGVKSEIISQFLDETERNDKDELKKIIEKKAKRYPDRNKLIAYLARQGFSYDDIKSALEDLFI